MKQIFRSRVSDAGRVVIPVELRSAFGLREGEEVLISGDAGAIRVTPLTRAIEQARDFFSALAPAEVVMSKELLKERRPDEVGHE